MTFWGHLAANSFIYSTQYQYNSTQTSIHSLQISPQEPHRLFQRLCFKSALRLVRVQHI